MARMGWTLGKGKASRALQYLQSVCNYLLACAGAFKNLACESWNHTSHLSSTAGYLGPRSVKGQCSNCQCALAEKAVCSDHVRAKVLRQE